MEALGGVFGAIIIAIFISLIFYFALGARGPWGTFWTFFLVLLFVIWAASLWIAPIGPVYWGIAWIPLFFVGLVFALLLAAIPASREEDIEATRTDVDLSQEEIERRRETNRTAATVSGFFWVFLVILLIAIIFGYMV